MASASRPAKDLALIAIFAAITAALGLIPPIFVPVSAVPITAQSMGPMLAGAILGARRAAASQALFIVLVAVGLPLLAGSRGGLGVLFGVSVGFLLGWIVVAALIGWFTERVGAPYVAWKGLIINIGFGIVALYVLGIAGMMIVGRLPLQKALLANLPFIPGDLVKAVLAAVIAYGVHRAYPGLLPARKRTNVN